MVSAIVLLSTQYTSFAVIATSFAVLSNILFCLSNLSFSLFQPENITSFEVFPVSDNTPILPGKYFIALYYQ